MTHADISEDEKNKISITDKLIRISVGIENHRDLIEDIKQAFNKVIDGPKSDKPYKISPIQMN
jgi:methionine-gamma-lyase